MIFLFWQIKMMRHGGKQSTYANVALYLKDNRPDVYKLYENAGMLVKLKPSRLGLTFLIPDTKAVKAMDKLLKTGKGEVTKHLSAHAIPIALCTAEDWSRHQKDIPNKLRKKIVVESIGAKVIKIKSGTLKPSGYNPYEEFDGHPNRVKTCAWDLSGTLDIDTPDAEYLYVDKFFKELKANLPKAKVGGYVQSGANKLYSTLTKCVSETVEWCKDKSGASPFRTLIARVITGLESMNTDVSRDCLEKLRCLASGNVAAEAFLLLDSPIFNVNCISTALQSAGELSDSATKYDLFIKGGGKYVACGNNEEELASALLMNAEDDNVFSNTVRELYKGIAENNNVSGISGEFMHPDLTQYIWTLDEFLITIADTYQKMCEADTISDRVCAANAMLYKNTLFSVTPSPESSTLGALSNDDIGAEIRARYMQSGAILSFAFKLSNKDNVFIGGDDEEGVPMPIEGVPTESSQMEKMEYESERKKDLSVIDRLASSINNLLENERKLLKEKLAQDI